MKPGFFELRTACDLVAKLERAIERLEGAAEDA